MPISEKEFKDLRSRILKYTKGKREFEQLRAEVLEVKNVPGAFAWLCEILPFEHFEIIRARLKSSTKLEIEKVYGQVTIFDVLT